METSAADLREKYSKYKWEVTVYCSSLNSLKKPHHEGPADTSVFIIVV